jgi:hypothetical protein
MLPRLSCLAAVAVLALPNLAAAQWATPPGGVPVYEFHLQTSGVFHCRNPLNLVRFGGTCAATGNVLTISESDGDALVLSFLGLDQTVAVTTFPTPSALGHFVVDADPGFDYPRYQYGLAFADFTLFARSLGPAVGMSGDFWYYRREPTLQSLLAFGGEGNANRFGLPTTPGPKGARFHRLAFGDILRPTIGNEDAVIPLAASAYLLPEPATVALTACGLLALAGVARRWRRA